MADIVKQLLLQLILILLNAFFAATEIAVISLNEKKLKARAENGDKKAGKMLKMIENPTQFLSTIQIGITLAGFLGSAFAADNFAERLSGFVVKTFNVSEAHVGIINTVAVIIITLVLSFFTLVLGELVPKRVAMKHKDKLAEAVCGAISFLSIVLKPVIWLLTVSTNGVLRLFRINPHEKEEPISEEDIVLMLDAGAGEGTLDHNDIEYIKNVFKLDCMTAGDVMTHRRGMVIISKESTDEAIMEMIETEGYSRIPVYSETTDNIIGILHTGDYLLKRTRKDFSIEQAMYQPTFVPETAHLDILLKDMQKEHNHIVVVINEYGEATGILTIEDILEEIVGEIWDERDEEIEAFTKINDDTYKVQCSADIEDFFEFFNLDTKEKISAMTVNGWLTGLLGNIPEQDCALEYDNLKITVTRANDLMAEEITVVVSE